MHSQAVHTIDTGYLNRGINKNALPPYVSSTSTPKHGDIRDVTLSYGRTTCRIVSKETLQLMEQWGLKRQVDKLSGFNIKIHQYNSYAHSHYELNKDELIYTPCKKYSEKVFLYTCNPRSVYLTMNAIKASINALLALDPSQETSQEVNQYLQQRAITKTLCLHYCLQPESSVTSILKDIRTRNFSLRAILRTLESAGFNQHLKILHPQTTWKE